MRREKRHRDAKSAPIAEYEPKSAKTSLSMNNFGRVLIDMGWRVAVATLSVAFAGIGLDRLLGTDPIFSILGIILAVVASNFVVIRFVKNNFTTGGTS